MTCWFESDTLSSSQVLHPKLMGMCAAVSPVGEIKGYCKKGGEEGHSHRPLFSTTTRGFCAFLSGYPQFCSLGDSSSPRASSPTRGSEKALWKCKVWLLPTHLRLPTLRIKQAVRLTIPADLIDLDLDEEVGLC